MALPTEADFNTPVGPELERYLATDSTGAKDRVRLFHLAWDVACSAFGGRQVLYERFFGGDPVHNAMLLYQTYNKQSAMDRVQRFLEREG
jgi:4-hydroxyphenylacetate 3-monooxygenase